MTQRTPWWQKGVVYQIYPRSFLDSNGDGVGDLHGVIQQLDYLAWLNIDAIWLSPIFTSPMADFGYDVADYRDIDPLFGSLAAMDALIEAAHARDLRVLLDLVPNHTSDQHAWFQESRASRDNAKADWYLWRDAKPDGSPPNNWLSYFGGSAWEWDEARGQYYLHFFVKEQPDLNWENPDVQAAMFDVIRFWLARGVDGFRIDVIDRLTKDPQFRDNPPNPDYDPARDQLKPGEVQAGSQIHTYSEMRPGIHEMIARLRAIFDEFDDRVMVGEVLYSAEPEFFAPYYALPGAHIPFNFAMIMLDWNAPTLRRFIDGYDAVLTRVNGWGNYVLGNHDRTRVATRIGEAQARVAAMLIMTLRGTPFIYYGEEIGMRDVPIPQELVQDPWGINIPGQSRDPVRTPMQWSDDNFAGFSTVLPWLPLASDYREQNVMTQRSHPRSMLHLYRELIDLRRITPALSIGTYTSIDIEDSANCLVYLREHDGERWLIALNLTSTARTIALAAAARESLGSAGRVVLSTHMDRAERVDLAVLHLRLNEGVIIRMGADTVAPPDAAM